MAAAEKNWNRKARAGKNSFPPTPFLFARPSDWILKFGIRIFVKKCSNINQKTPPVLRSEYRAKDWQWGIPKKIMNTKNKNYDKIKSLLLSMEDLVFVFSKEGIYIEYFQSKDNPLLYVPPEQF
ncbi:MAG: hypothetical protein QF747_01065 [Patescibacteria group bacterium]|nr:hypothetical protein [Patescibacteria group bacterium]